MTDTTVISDAYRQPITVQRHRTGNGVVIRTPGACVILSEAELDRLFSFAHGLGVLQRFTAPESTLSHKQTQAG
jgi:hypothetical protein